MSTSQWTVSSRPQKLEEFFGHPAATAYVRGMIKSNAAPSCLAIFGPSGTGKTTLGRIVGALLSGWKGDPFKNPDLYEMPANVDRGIDDVRNAIQRSKYSPQGGKRRIILVDEVHGLVGPAASALLKAVEDAAPRATWIVCTDQPHKLNRAMLRRGQTINLNYVEEPELVKAMEYVLKQRKVGLGQNQQKILQRVAQASHGVPGIAIQMLETLCTIVRGGGKVVDALKAAVQNNPGREGLDSALDYVSAVVAGDELRAVKAVAECGSPEGVLELSNQMLSQLIRVAGGLNPSTGLGWVVKKKTSIGKNDLSTLLMLQNRFVAALDVNSRRIVPADSILYSLARK